MEDILAAIPQRPPFLFVDKIIKREGNSITTQRTLKEEEYFFKGHFQGNPIIPYCVNPTYSDLLSLRWQID